MGGEELGTAASGEGVDNSAGGSPMHNHNEGVSLPLFIPQRFHQYSLDGPSIGALPFYHLLRGELKLLEPLVELGDLFGVSVIGTAVHSWGRDWESSRR